MRRESLGSRSMMVAALVPEGDPNLTVFIVIMLLGFFVGTYGHIAKNRGLIIAGIVMIFGATVVLPLLIFRGGK
jgi:hypothetical protein